MFTETSTISRKWKALSVFFAFLLVAASCGDDDDSADTGGEATEDTSAGDGDAAADSNLPDTITIGWLNEMSGAAAFCGQQELDGANLAIEEAQETGFLEGADIELQIEDTSQTAEGAVSGHRRLVDQGVPVIVGPCVGGMGDATVGLSEQAQIPQILTTASGTDISGEYAYRAGIRQQQYAANAIAAIASEGAETASVIWDQEQPSIVAVWRDTQKPALEEEGIELLAEEAVTAQVTDFSSQIESVTRDNPDAVGVLLLGAPNLTVVTQLREAGYDGQIWGQQGMLNDFFIDGGPPVEGTLVAVGYAPNFTSDSSVNFTERFREKYNATPSELNAHGYDATWMALRAIKNANSVEADAVKQALDQITELDGAQGSLTFDEDGEVSGEGGVVVIEDGDIVGIDLEG